MNKKVSKSIFIFLLGAIGLIVAGVVLYLLLIGNRSVSTSSNISEIEKINTQSQSDSVESIEKDLEETDLNNIDRELQDIEGELNSAY